MFILPFKTIQRLQFRTSFGKTSPPSTKYTLKGIRPLNLTEKQLISVTGFVGSEYLKVEYFCLLKIVPP